LRRDRKRTQYAHRFPVAAVEHQPTSKRTTQSTSAREVVPRLLPESRPVHEFVRVDVFVPGCPPSADVIHFGLTELLAGRMPDLTNKTRFGA
jgi:NAD-reducing hydrogenase small subunit